MSKKKKKVKKHKLILNELKRKLKQNRLHCNLNDTTANNYMTGSNKVLIEMIHFIEEKL